MRLICRDEEDHDTITQVEIDVFSARRAPQPIPQALPPAAGPPTPTAQPGLTPRAVLVIAAVSFGAGILTGVALAR